MEKTSCRSEIERAAALIRAGELVAFPTETVYGLGANALEESAVDKIYEIKGRPPTSPLIVHVSSIEMAKSLVADWPAQADLMAGHFWPGPLTLVLPKLPCISGRVTAGLNTVGLRMPNHHIALSLIEAAGVPIAAPSANRFTELSPTTAAHVRESLGNSVKLILDGGPTDVGIESTVLAFDPLRGPLLLRPGMISRGQIEQLIGPVNIATASGNGAHASPGMHSKHYSPKTPLYLVQDGDLPQNGRGAYLYITRPASYAHSIKMPAEPSHYAAVLYAILHGVDRQGWNWIAVEHPPPGELWAAILDRLKRAAVQP